MSTYIGRRPCDGLVKQLLLVDECMFGGELSPFDYELALQLRATVSQLMFFSSVCRRRGLDPDWRLGDAQSAFLSLEGVLRGLEGIAPRGWLNEEMRMLTYGIQHGLCGLPPSSSDASVFGAVVGDVCGSVYESRNHKTRDLDSIDLTPARSRATDDSVLTVATTEVLTGQKLDFRTAYRDFATRYPHAGYGQSFRRWAREGDGMPCGSFGNGSAMRVSPVGWAADTPEEVIRMARWSAAVTHNHPEGMMGAAATALAVLLARQGAPKDAVVSTVAERYRYELPGPVDTWRDRHDFDPTCSDTLPVVLQVFLESESFEHTLRLAISVGGDSDTIACIVGGIAGAFYRHIPEELLSFARERLDAPLLKAMDEFQRLC